MRCSTALALLVAFALEPARSSAEPAPDSAVIDDLRRRLAQEPAGANADRIRLQLCAARRSLGDLRAIEPTALDAGATTAPVELDTAVPTPPSILRQRMRGDQRAVIESTIDADGCVVPERVASSTSPEWAIFAKEQTARWVFRPATRDGRPVAVRYDLSVKYKRR